MIGLTKNNQKNMGEFIDTSYNFVDSLSERLAIRLKGDSLYQNMKEDFDGSQKLVNEVRSERNLAIAELEKMNNPGVLKDENKNTELTEYVRLGSELLTVLDAKIDKLKLAMLMLEEVRRSTLYDLSDLGKAISLDNVKTKYSEIILIQKNAKTSLNNAKRKFMIAEKELLKAQEMFDLINGGKEELDKKIRFYKLQKGIDKKFITKSTAKSLLIRPEQIPLPLQDRESVNS